MTTVLTPNAKQQFFTNNGDPAVGYRLFTYAAGTTTKKATSSNSIGTPNANPITLNFRGEADVWLDPNVSFKFVFAPPGSDDPPTSPIWTVDNVVSSQLITLYGGVDTGSTNAYIINFTANFAALTDGIVIYFLPANTNTNASTLNVNGLGAVPILQQSGGTLATGNIIANVMTGVIYRGGNFYLLYPAAATGSFAATLSGFTTVVTGTIKYRIVNGIVFLYSDSLITGTSNSAAMKMTGLPAAILPSVSTGRLTTCYSLQDNSVGGKVGAAFVSPVVPDITISLLAVSGAAVVGGGAFTAAGTKGIEIGWAMSYPL